MQNGDVFLSVFEGEEKLRKILLGEGKRRGKSGDLFSFSSFFSLKIEECPPPFH